MAVYCGEISGVSGISLFHHAEIPPAGAGRSAGVDPLGVHTSAADSQEPGKRADMIILDKDPFDIDPMEIKDIQVLETIKDGNTVYTKE